MVASTATSGNSQQRDKELKELLEVIQKGKAQALDTLAKQGGLKNLDINARVRTPLWRASCRPAGPRVCA